MCGVDAVRDDAVIEVRRQGRQGYVRLLALFKNEDFWDADHVVRGLLRVSSSARNSV